MKNLNILNSTPQKVAYTLPRVWFKQKIENLFCLKHLFSGIREMVHWEQMG